VNTAWIRDKNKERNAVRTGLEICGVAAGILTFLLLFPVLAELEGPFTGWSLAYVAATLATLGLLAFPALMTGPHMAEGRFRWALGIGLWLLLWSVVFCVILRGSIFSVLLVLAASTLCATSFLSGIGMARK
jgi:hypothetical protein